MKKILTTHNSTNGRVEVARLVSHDDDDDFVSSCLIPKPFQRRPEVLDEALHRLRLGSEGEKKQSCEKCEEIFDTRHFIEDHF